MFVLSQTLCFTETHSVVMLNSTLGNERWAFPRYFEYDIVRGPGISRVEWIRVYTPGMWQPVAESTLGPAPDHREWRRVYHFDVYWPRDSAYTWQCRDWRTRGYQRLGDPRPSIGSGVYAGLSSSSASSAPDGAWREPSPPPSYDPNFDWDE